MCDCRRACVCVLVREGTSLYHMSCGGGRLAHGTACKNADAKDALLCRDGKKKNKIKIPIMLFHSYSERVRGDEVALGGCCHGDDLNHCVA